MQESELSAKLNKIQNQPLGLIENELNEIIALIKNNPKEFIAYMKYSRPVCAGLNKVLTNLPYAATSAMQDSYITPVIYYDGSTRQRKVIFIDPNKQDSLKKLNQINLDNNVKVYCHSCRHFDDQFRSSLEKKNNDTYILPLNKILFSTITSSVQTTAVEKACKIVNYLTAKKRLNINLYGQCQGVDFASKMVGDLNCITQANINLHFDTVHVLQDPFEIMERIRKHNQTVNITGINVKQTLCAAPWHPSCKTEKLRQLAEAFMQEQKYTNNSKEIYSLNNRNDGKLKLI